jgi:cystathionine beta-lyase
MDSFHKVDRRKFLTVAGFTAGAFGMQESLAAIDDASSGGKYNFDEVVDRTGSNCIKWDRAIDTYGSENIQVAMTIADMDFRVAPAITKALKKRIEHDVWGYGQQPPTYKQAIADWAKERHGEDIDTDLILHTAGVHEGIISTLRAFAPRGSKVILQTPAYSTFYLDIRKSGCVPSECPLKSANGRYEMDFESLERTIDEQTRALILCNPNNPTGNCWTADDLMTLGEICTRRDIVVLADEVHCDLTRSGVRYTPYGTLDNEEIVRNSVTLKSTSKPFNLAATKIGYLYSGNEDYIARIQATGHNDWLNILGFIACNAAYSKGGDWLDQAKVYIDGNMDFVDEYVRSRMPGVSFVKPEGTYLAWLDFGDFFSRVGADDMTNAANKKLDASAKPLTPEEFMVKYFIENAGIYLNDGSRYGPGGAGHMRMNLATSRKRVELALSNITEAMAAA